MFKKYVKSEFIEFVNIVYIQVVKFILNFEIWLIVNCVVELDVDEVIE